MGELYNTFDGKSEAMIAFRKFETTFERFGKILLPRTLSCRCHHERFHYDMRRCLVFELMLFQFFSVDEC